MFDLNSIINVDCLICRDKLIDISDREVGKTFTKKEYRIYLQPLTKLDCKHYYHINCLKASIISDAKLSYNIISKKCPYCSNQINGIISLFNDLKNKDMLYDKKVVSVKRIVKKQTDIDNEKSRCISTTVSGKKCKLFESSIGSKYCRIHKYHMDKSKIHNEMNTTHTYTNEMNTNTNMNMNMNTNMNEMNTNMNEMNTNIIDWQNNLIKNTSITL